MQEGSETTRWLERLSQGDEGALERVIALLYEEVREVARRMLGRERRGHTLNATALVNEVYLKLSANEEITAESRTRFLAVTAKTMKRVLIDYARTRKRLKRGGGQTPQSLSDQEPFLTEEEADEILALGDALDRLAELNPRASEIVEQRFFAGLSLSETAELVGVSSKTVQREWTVARAWLKKELLGRIDV